MKPARFKLWHLDNLVLAMQFLHLAIANLCQTQFESQMTMILCLIYLHSTTTSLRRHTTTSQERYPFAYRNDEIFVCLVSLFGASFASNLFLFSRCGFTTLDWEVLIIKLRRSVMIPEKTLLVAGKSLLWHASVLFLTTYLVIAQPWKLNGNRNVRKAGTNYLAPLCRSVTGTSIQDHLVYYGVELMSGQPGTCRIVMDSQVVEYGSTDHQGNVVLSRVPATPVIGLNTEPENGVALN